jgi:single-strand DNA-binding protein
MTNNTIVIIGYLGRDPELRYIPTGAGVCSFSVATTEKIKDREVTTWFKISAWGKTGENCQQYLQKGSQVYIEGRLRQEEYTDRDGNKRYTLEVNASNVRFFGGGQSSDTPEDTQKRREALKAKEDDDIPF